MFRNAVILAMCLVATNASAQQTSAPAAAPSAAGTPAAQAVVPMEEPLPGDHWTYEIRDEIPSKMASTREDIVTEVKPTSISVS